MFIYYRQLTNFTLNTSLPVYTGLFLEVALISPRSKDLWEGCAWKGEKFIINRLIQLVIFSY